MQLRMYTSWHEILHSGRIWICWNSFSLFLGHRWYGLLDKWDIHCHPHRCTWVAKLKHVHLQLCNVADYSIVECTVTFDCRVDFLDCGEICSTPATWVSRCIPFQGFRRNTQFPENRVQSHHWKRPWQTYYNSVTLLLFHLLVKNKTYFP